jgi:hypothetical protein
MAKRPKPPRTYAELAARIGVTPRTIANWVTHPQWPGRRDSGDFDVKAVRAFCDRHNLGPAIQQRNRSAGADRDSLREALTVKTLEQSENERIWKERQLVAQAVEQGVVMLASDVVRKQSQSVATVMALQDAFSEAMDRALPESAVHKANVMAIVGRLPQDTYAAMRSIQ